MTKTRKTIALLAITISLAGSVQADDERSVVHAMMSKADLSGNIFDRADASKSTQDGVPTIDVTTFLSSDEKFSSGMYKIGKLYYEQTEPLDIWTLAPHEQGEWLAFKQPIRADHVRSITADLTPELWDLGGFKAVFYTVPPEDLTALIPHIGGSAA